MTQQWIIYQAWDAPRAGTADIAVASTRLWADWIADALRLQFPESRVRYAVREVRE